MGYVLTKADRDFLEMIADDYCLDISRHYSGRGMYGDTCLGITFDENSELDEFTLGYTIAKSGPESLGNITAYRSRKDSMGRGYIVYWELVEWGTDS